jgi:hypothetical protein
MTDAQKKTAGIAITSLVLGILGLVCFGPFAAIPAVICGHVAKSRIRKSAGQLEGEGLALAGLILGYISIGLMVVLLPLYAAIAIPAFVKAREATQMNVCVNNMRIIDGAIDQWAIENDKSRGTSVNPADLTKYFKAQTLPSCPAGGTYTFSLVGDETECSKHGTASEPTRPSSGGL